MSINTTVTVITTAPDVYDYNYTTETSRFTNDRGQVVRTVEVIADCAQYQADRYSSGLYMTTIAL